MPKMIALPSDPNVRYSAYAYIPSWDKLLKQVKLNCDVFIDGKPILQFISPCLKNANRRYFGEDKTEYKDSKFISVAKITKILELSDLDIDRLSIDDKTAILYGSTKLICGFNPSKIALVLPYISFIKEYRITIFRALHDGLLKLCKVNTIARNEVKPFFFPLLQSDRIALNLEAKSLRHTKKKSAIIPIVSDYHHSLGKSNALNLFTFSTLDLELSFRDNGIDKSKYVCGIYAKSYRMAKDSRSVWSLIGYIARNKNKAKTVLNDAMIKALGFVTIPNALKSLGLLATDCFRYELPYCNMATLEHCNLSNVACITEFWKLFNFYPMGEVKQNNPICLEYRKLRK